MDVTSFQDCWFNESGENLDPGPIITGMSFLYRQEVKTHLHARVIFNILAHDRMTFRYIAVFSVRLGLFACKLGGLGCDDGMGMDMSSNRFKLFSMIGSDDTQRKSGNNSTSRGLNRIEKNIGSSEG